MRHIDKLARDRDIAIAFSRVEVKTKDKKKKLITKYALKYGLSERGIYRILQQMRVFRGL